MMVGGHAAPHADTDRSLLLLEDDEALSRVLARVLGARGFEVRQASTVAEAMASIKASPPAFGVFDLTLPDGSGLEAVRMLADARADARQIVLTGHGSLDTAVAATKMGAVDYLVKPTRGDDIVRALLVVDDEQPFPPVAEPTPEEVRWGHIQEVFRQCGQNVSESARRLSMHRRTLQRVLERGRRKGDLQLAAS
jgi:two-component system response regulator RegA